MSGKRKRDYVDRHEQIVKKLTEIAQESGSGCFSVAKLAAELGMDQRTVRAHLRIIEFDNAGVFIDSEEKQFCTREGVNLLSKKLGMKRIISDQ